MNVTGPDWPSTEELRKALADVEPRNFTLQWGRRGFNGWEQLLRFAESGVPCPLATNSLDEAKEYVRSGKGPLWGRRLLHTQGTDIIGSNYLTLNRSFSKRWMERDFWVEPKPILREFRQHVWDGKCIRIGEKVQTEPTTRYLPIRSRRNGWTIDYAAKIEDAALKESVRNAAKSAVAALGYIGGAVDLIQATDGAVYVLEVNSAPALRDANTLSAYVKAITAWAPKAATAGHVE